MTMKRMITLALAIAAALLGVPAAHAIVTIVDFEIEGIHASAKTFESAQRVLPGGGAVSDVTITFGGATGVTVVPKLASKMILTGAAPFDVKVTFVTGATVTEVRTYSNVVVKDIAVPQLDATSRDELLFVVRLESASMQSASTGPLPPSPGTKQRVVVESQFRVDVEDLPSTHIVRLASHRIIPCARGLCDSLNGFEVLVRGDDVAKWRQWFNKVSQVPTYSTKARYKILTPDLTQSIMTVTVEGLRPVSFEETVDNIGPKAQVRMRPVRVVVGN
jgi:hypothetical protein